MTWDEISKKYDKEKTNFQILERTPKLEKGWGRIMRSTDKLVWLFMMSNGVKSGPLKSRASQ